MITDNVDRSPTVPPVAREPKAYFTWDSSDTINCNRCRMIWCLQSTTHLNMHFKMGITPTLLRRRNWSIALFLVEAFWGILKLATDILRKGKLVIFFNVVIILMDIIGVIGALRMSPLPLMAYFLGMILGLGGLLILFILSISVDYITADDQLTLFILYLPIIIDIFFYIYQTYFIIPVVRLAIKVENQEKAGLNPRPVLKNTTAV